MNIKKALLGCMFVAPVVAHSVSWTGFYVGASAGATYRTLKTVLRPSDGKKADQKDLGKTSGCTIPFEFMLGGGVEFHRVFVGGQFFGGYSVKKISAAKDQTLGKVSLLIQGETWNFNSLFDQDVTARANYGGAVQLGGRISGNCLAYASFGVEWTRFNVQQFLALLYKDANLGDGRQVRGLLLANGKDGRLTHQSEIIKGFDLVNVAALALDAEKTDTAKVTTFAFTPGLGLRCGLSSGIFFGLEVRVPIGLNKKFDSSCLLKGGAGTITEVPIGNAEPDVVDLTPLSFHESEHDMFLTSRLGVEIKGVVGYKF
jgi:opacity protein-like surface antigen